MFKDTPILVTRSTLPTLSEGIVDAHVAQMRSEFVFVGSIGSKTPTFESFSIIFLLFVLQSLHLRPERQEPNSVGSKHLLHLHTKFYFHLKKVVEVEGN